MENQTKSASAKQLMLWLVLFVNQWQSFMKYSRKVWICTVCYKKADGDMRQFGASVYFFPDLKINLIGYLFMIPVCLNAEHPLTSPSSSDFSMELW